MSSNDFKAIQKIGASIGIVIPDEKPSEVEAGIEWENKVARVRDYLARQWSPTSQPARTAEEIAAKL